MSQHLSWYTKENYVFAFNSLISDIDYTSKFQHWTFLKLIQSPLTKICQLLFVITRYDRKQKALLYVSKKFIVLLVGVKNILTVFPCREVPLSPKWSQLPTVLMSTFFFFSGANLIYVYLSIVTQNNRIQF